MWFWRQPYDPKPDDDDWEDQPPLGGAFQWGLRIMVPILILIYGVSAIANQQVVYSGRYASITLHRTSAIAMGNAAVCGAIFLHCHYFWGNIYNQAWLAVLGKIVSAAGFIAAMGVVLVRVGIYGK